MVSISYPVKSAETIYLDSTVLTIKPNEDLILVYKIKHVGVNKLKRLL